ncbi:GSCFA domain-containing protein [Flavobacterium micromati]
MQFRTQIPIPKSKFQIDYTSKILSLGSCFAVNIAERLDYFKFQNSCNRSAKSPDFAFFLKHPLKM